MLLARGALSYVRRILAWNTWCGYIAVCLLDGPSQNTAHHINEWYAVGT
jgi:hypothetical protein